MSATNHTDPLNLSQFIDEDRPSWLGDYNGDMGKIAAAHQLLLDQVAELTAELLVERNRITNLATATGHGAI